MITFWLIICSRHILTRGDFWIRWCWPTPSTYFSISNKMVFKHVKPNPPFKCQNIDYGKPRLGAWGLDRTPHPPPEILFWILVFSTSIGMIYNMYPMYCAMKLYHSPKLSLLNIVRNDRLGGGVLFGKRQCIQAYMCTTCTIFLCWFSFYRNELICYIIKSIKTRLYSNKSIQFYQNIILHLGPLSKP